MTAAAIPQVPDTEERSVPVDTTFTDGPSPRVKFRAAREAAMQKAPRAAVTPEGCLSTVADVLIVGGADTLLVPVLDVLDGCGWTVRFQAGDDAALQWLDRNRTCVAVVEVDTNWRELAARLRHKPNCGNIILAAAVDLPIDEAMTAGVHDTLRLPVDRYDLLWSVVTAWREAQSASGNSWSFP